MRAFLLALLLATVAGAQDDDTENKVYRKVNEDGSVTYTDQKPAEGEEAEEMDLPEIQVVQPPVVTRSLRDARQREERKRAAREGRAEPVPMYEDLEIVAPEPEETLWNIGAVLTVQLSTSEALAPDHQVNYYYDGELRGAASSLSLTLKDVFRGTHTVKADIVDAAGRVVASTAPVTFYVRQHSIQHNNR